VNYGRPCGRLLAQSHRVILADVGHSELLVHHDDERIRLVSAGAVMLVYLRVRFGEDELVEIHAAQEYLRSTVGRHALLVVVGDIRPELSERARSFSRRTTEEFAGSVACLAQVVEARGFTGAAVRCVMAGMRVLTKPPYPVREFSTTRPAAMWMAPQLAGLELPFTATPERLLDWVDRAREPAFLQSGIIEA
jgi:hypothetical protein